MTDLRGGPVAVAMLVALGAVLAACGGAAEENRPLQPTASDTKLRSSLAPLFSVSTGKGSVFSLEEHSGEVVVLYFSFPG